MTNFVKGSPEIVGKISNEFIRITKGEPSMAKPIMIPRKGRTT
jgi:hypothetical protein